MTAVTGTKPPPPPPPPKANPTVEPKSQAKPGPTAAAPTPKPTPTQTAASTAAPTPKPTATTSAETLARVNRDPNVQLRQAQLQQSGQVTTAQARSVIDTGLEATRTVEAPAPVRETVRAQLQRVDSRLQSGEVTPNVAMGQARIWTQHLEEAAATQSREQIARAEEISRMNPLQRTHEFAIGFGTGILRTGESAVNLAQTVNNLNPVTAASNVASDTLGRTIRTGDLGQSFKDSLEQQKKSTGEALQNSSNTARALGTVVQDYANVDPVLSSTRVASETLVNTARTGDLGGSFNQAFARSTQDAVTSRQRLVTLAGDITGVNNILSGDPRLIGEGTFNLASTLAPFAKAKNVAVLTKVDDVAGLGRVDDVTAVARPAPAALPDAVRPPRAVIEPPPPASPYQPYAPPTELPRQSLPKGQVIPAPDPLAIAPDGAVYPHTTLGTHVSKAGYSYPQSATFPGGRPSVYGAEQVPWGRTDWSAHPSTGTPHPVPHTHPILMDPTPFGTGGRPADTFRIPASGDGHMKPGVSGGNFEFEF